MKKYSIILADPPWNYSNWKDKKHGSHKPHYHGIKPSNLSKLPVQNVAAEDSVLLMWATAPMMPDAIALMESWGFKYKTIAFVWNKKYKSGKPYCGLGFYTRSGSEFVLLGTRGKVLERKSHSVLQVFDAEVERPHSTKPDIKSKIDELFGAGHNRLEMFGRKKTAGWKVIGNEIDGKDIRDSLRELCRQPVIITTKVPE